MMGILPREPDDSEISPLLLSPLLLAGSLQLTGIDPPDGSANLRLNSSLALSFDRELDATTVTIDTSGGACAGSIQISTDGFATCIGFAAAPVLEGGTNVQLRPLWQEGKSHQIRITTALRATGGETVLFGFTSLFGHSAVSAPVATVAPTLVLWLKAEAGVSLAGTQVLSWADQSGNAILATAAFAGRPAYLAGDSQAGGRPVVDFAGGASNDCLEFDNEPLFDIGTPSIVAVVHMDQGDRIFSKNGGAGGTGRRKLELNETGFRSGTDALFQTYGLPFNAGALNVLSVVARANNDTTFAVNGTARVENFAFDYTTFNNSSPNLGGAFSCTQGDGRYSGYVAELLLYSGALSDLERQSIECYLSEKYNLTVVGC